MGRWVIPVFVLLLLGGCGTINSLIVGPPVYGGARSVGRYCEPMGNMVSCCDLPFSFALDTGIMPITLLAELSRWSTGWPSRSHRIYPITESEHRTTAVKENLSTLHSALLYYRAWTGSYPDSDAGLKVLYRRTGTAEPEKWDGIYLRGDGSPLDPWGQPHVYRFAGIRNPKGYDFFSSGPDRTPETSDDIEGGAGGGT